jgi:hypothetical protein
VTDGVYFQFNPSVTNYVGNYGPGLMEDITSTIVEAIQGVSGTPILRDLGKTFRSVVQNGESAAAGQVGFFRQVQLLDVTGDRTAATYATSGVIGSEAVPSANAKYYTFYVAVPVTGQGYVSPNIYPIAGGQM